MEKILMQLKQSIQNMQKKICFICPTCGSPLTFHNDDDDIKMWMFSDLNGHTFPIISMVPDLTSDMGLERAQSAETLESFNFQYGKHDWIYDYDCRRVERILHQVFGIDADSVQGKSVLIVGCGSGAEVESFRKLGAGIVLGFDLSTSIQQAQVRQLSFDNTLIVRADALSPPLDDQTFDIVYCDGVLPHTEKPLEILQKIVRLKAPHGILYVRTLMQPVGFRASAQLFPRRALRKVTKRLSSSALWRLSYGFALLSKIPVLGRLAKKLFVYFDAAEGNIEITRLINFRMYGDHTYRHHLSDSEITTAILSSNKASKISRKAALYVVE